MAMKLLIKILAVTLVAIPINCFAIDWIPIAWHEINTDHKDSKRGPILVEAKISNIAKSYYFQLDTGASETFLYSYSAFSDPELIKYFLTRPAIPLIKNLHGIYDIGFQLEGTIAKNVISTRPSMVLKHMGKKLSSIIGIAGLTAFSEPLLTIDFIKNRFAISSNLQEVEATTALPIFYKPYDLIDGVPVISLNIGKKIPFRAMVDTGASSTALMVFKADNWSKITGRKLENELNTKIENVAATTGFIDCTAAPSIEPIEINGLSFGKMNVEYCTYKDQDNTSFGDGFEFDGILGNAAFFDRGIVIFDQMKKQIGIALQK
jgi:hypothetical protein